MSPSSPAFLSSVAHQVIRWSAASTSAGGSSRPISAALPESSRHRCTRASRWACSRRLRALSGATSMTARAIAARSPPGVSRPARPSTSASAARASAGVQVRGGRGDDLHLRVAQRPGAERGPGAGQLDLQVVGQGQHRLGLPAGLGQRVGQLGLGELLPDQRHLRRAGSSGQPGSGRRRISSATAACLSAHAEASARSSAHSTPISSLSEAPANRSPDPAAYSASPCSAALPGATSRGCPAANAPAGPGESPPDPPGGAGLPGTPAGRRRPRGPRRGPGPLTGPGPPPLTGGRGRVLGIGFFAGRRGISSRSTASHATHSSSVRQSSSREAAPARPHRGTRPGRAENRRRARGGGAPDWDAAGLARRRAGSSSRPGSGETGPWVTHHRPFGKMNLT